MLEKQFIQNTEKLEILRHAHKILLAVSGGVDSMVMTNLFIKFGFDIGIAHCNFLLRDEASNGDQKFVKDFADKQNIPFYTINFDTKKIAAERKISIEMAARDLRYEWFEELRKKHNYTTIATAHNLNDVVETFFLNLTRGTGLRGLTGITSKTETLVRPLLFASRTQIESYANENQITFRTDETNASTEFTRNKIRLDIVPEFEKINPAFLQTMQSNINHIANLQNIIEQQNEKLKSQIISRQNEKIVIDTSFFANKHEAQIHLFEILREYNFNSATVNNIVDALDGESGKKFYSPTHVLLKNRDTLIIAENKTEQDATVEIDEKLEIVDYPISLHFEKTENKNIKIDKNANVAYLNLDKIKFPLTLRKWQHGDSFTPFGMRGKKKLSDYFIDIKLSQFDKDEQYVLLSDEKIVWVVNRRIDENYKIDDSCKNVLKVIYKSIK